MYLSSWRFIYCKLQWHSVNETQLNNIIYVIEPNRTFQRLLMIKDKFVYLQERDKGLTSNCKIQLSKLISNVIPTTIFHHYRRQIMWSIYIIKPCSAILIKFHLCFLLVIIHSLGILRQKKHSMNNAKNKYQPRQKE